MHPCPGGGVVDGVVGGGGRVVVDPVPELEGDGRVVNAEGKAVALPRGVDPGRGVVSIPSLYTNPGPCPFSFVQVNVYVGEESASEFPAHSYVPGGASSPNWTWSARTSPQSRMGRPPGAVTLHSVNVRSVNKRMGVVWPSRTVSGFGDMETMMGGPSLPWAMCSLNSTSLVEVPFPFLQWR